MRSTAAIPEILEPKGILAIPVRWVMGLLWLVVWIIMTVLTWPLGWLHWFIDLPDYAMAMARMCTGGEVVDPTKREGYGEISLESVILFPLWFPFAVLMAMIHLLVAGLMLVLFHKEEARFHVTLVKMAFGFMSAGD